jgi:hypothetical protein
MSSIPRQPAYNDASRPDDAREFTDEYIRLGMPGWPSVGNVIPTVSAAIPSGEAQMPVLATAAPH